MHIMRRNVKRSQCIVKKMKIHMTILDILRTGHEKPQCGQNYINKQIEQFSHDFSNIEEYLQLFSVYHPLQKECYKIS